MCVSIGGFRVIVTGFSGTVCTKSKPQVLLERQTLKRTIVVVSPAPGIVCDDDESSPFYG